PRSLSSRGLRRLGVLVLAVCQPFSALGPPIYSPGRLENRDHNQHWVRYRPKDTRLPKYRSAKGRNKPAPMGNLLRLRWRVRSASENYLDELVSCFCSF